MLCIEYISNKWLNIFFILICYILRPFNDILYKTRSRLILLYHIYILYSYANNFFSNLKFHQQCHISIFPCSIIFTCHVTYCYMCFYNYIYIHKTWSYMIYILPYISILYLPPINSSYLYDNIIIKGYFMHISLLFIYIFI